MDDKQDDHARGCEGRQYTCTCGYDDRIATALEAQAAEIARLKDIVEALTDDDPCYYDHHGYCQAHGWMAVSPACPHARARALTGSQSHD